MATYNNVVETTHQALAASTVDTVNFLAAWPNVAITNKDASAIIYVTTDGATAPTVAGGGTFVVPPASTVVCPNRRPAQSPVNRTASKTVDVSGASAGTWTVAWGPVGLVQTATLQWNCVAADLIAALTAVGLPGVTVTGGPANAATFTVGWVNNSALDIVIGTSGLTGTLGGGTTAATFAQTSPLSVKLISAGTPAYSLLGT